MGEGGEGSGEASGRCATEMAFKMRAGTLAWMGVGCMPASCGVKAWVGRGGGECRFVPTALEPGVTSAPPTSPAPGFLADLSSFNYYFFPGCKPS